MKEKNKKKQIIKISVFITSIFVIFISVTYAFINMTLAGIRKQVITTGTLDLVLDEDENNLTISNALPMYDEVGMLQDAFTFHLINQGTSKASYKIKLVDITTGDALDKTVVKYGLTKNGVSSIATLSTLTDGVIDSGTISGNNTTIDYVLRLWIDSEVTENSVISGKSLSYRIDAEVGQTTKNASCPDALLCWDISFEPLETVVVSADETTSFIKISNDILTFGQLLGSKLIRTYNDGTIDSVILTADHFGGYGELLFVYDSIIVVKEKTEIDANTVLSPGVWSTKEVFEELNISSIKIVELDVLFEWNKTTPILEVADGGTDGNFNKYSNSVYTKEELIGATSIIVYEDGTSTSTEITESSIQTAASSSILMVASAFMMVTEEYNGFTPGIYLTESATTSNVAYCKVFKEPSKPK